MVTVTFRRKEKKNSLTGCDGDVFYYYYYLLHRSPHPRQLNKVKTPGNEKSLILMNRKLCTRPRARYYVYRVLLKTSRADLGAGSIQNRYSPFGWWRRESDIRNVSVSFRKKKNRFFKKKKKLYIHVTCILFVFYGDDKFYFLFSKFSIETYN